MSTETFLAIAAVAAYLVIAAAIAAILKANNADDEDIFGLAILWGFFAVVFLAFGPFYLIYRGIYNGVVVLRGSDTSETPDAIIDFSNRQAPPSAVE